MQAPSVDRLSRALLGLALGCALAATQGCRSTNANEARDADPVEVMLVRLYEAFGFEAGGEPDWDAMRALCARDAVFFAPSTPSAAPRGVGIEAFFDDFRAYAQSEPVTSTGLHERILLIRFDTFGGVAHAFVSFEGHVPGEESAQTRGLDSIQLVREEGAWRLASFATQYERPGLALPTRFGGVERAR